MVNVSDNIPLGKYTITITGTGGGKTRTENWILHVANTTSLSVFPPDFSLLPGESITLTASLVSGDEPLPDKRITWFSSDGSLIASGTTDASGKVTVTYTAPLSPGSVEITASFDGDNLFASSNEVISGIVETGAGQAQIPATPTQKPRVALPLWVTVLVLLTLLAFSGSCIILKLRKSKKK